VSEAQVWHWLSGFILFIGAFVVVGQMTVSSLHRYQV
jgi:hypothetical protein